MKSLDQIAKESYLNKDQLQKIEDTILSHGQFTPETVRAEIDWFCSRLGMADNYFKTIPLETIAAHIEGIKAAEINAMLRKDKDLQIDFATESGSEAIYIVDDEHENARAIERRIEKKYSNYRIQSYRTLGKASGVEHLRMYLVQKPSFALDEIQSEKKEVQDIACTAFLNTAAKTTIRRYQRILDQSSGWETPLIDVTEKEDTNEHRIMIATNRESSSRFFSNVSDVINSHSLVSNRKYIEQFSNGKTVYVFYLDKIKNEELLHDLIEDISLVYVIPDSPLSALFRSGKLDAQETVFGVSAWSFAHQFLFGYNEEYLKLAEVLKDSPELLGILRRLKTKLAKDTYTETAVWDAILHNYSFLKKAFQLFDKKFNPFIEDHDIDKDADKLEKELKRCIATDIHREIFMAVLLFVKICLRTNFYKNEKTSIAFMYDPKFLNRVDYPETPFGIFHVIGIEFRGFHIRFRDIARGGIRIVRSHNYQTYINNSDFIFDENYNLAFTQQKKNKDIPEGGSKGTILLGLDYQENADIAFKKYVNGLLDLMITEPNILDYYGQEVILFLGPDEGTADLMEWASQRARALNFPYWKSFSTGKPVALGGIPHDLYGMTTNSVNEYVLDILGKLGIREKDITKVMTGGPDGDLGSNEILISKDNIIAIIDGSGVLYDPEGLNRRELTRLAKARKMVENFKREKLSSLGFLVTIRDNKVTLPGGEKVTSGLEFRNTFHLNPKFKADLFAPCGGRPSSINISNWKQFLDDEGNPRFRFIVEGANLFLTQGARLRLEEHGVIIYKDASANKGGVTSSSLEVFASLALSDQEYDRLMREKDGVIPEFRSQYIREIIQIIRENARLEFEVIWKENERRGTPRSVLTDQVSGKINQVTDAIYTSQLFDDKKLFKKVIECCCPLVLVNEIGFNNILKRVPGTYLKAVFASRLASRYVYSYGLEANEIDFHNFLKEYK